MVVIDWHRSLDHVYGSFDPWRQDKKDLDLPCARALWNINPWKHWEDQTVNDYKEELYVVKQLQRVCLECYNTKNSFSPRDTRTYVKGLVLYSSLPQHVQDLIWAWLDMDDGLSLTKRITRVLGFVLSYISAPCTFDHLKQGENRYVMS